VRYEEQAHKERVPLEHSCFEQTWGKQQDHTHQYREEPIQRHNATNAIGEETGRRVVWLRDINHDEAGYDEEYIHAKAAEFNQPFLVRLDLYHDMAIDDSQRREGSQILQSVESHWNVLTSSLLLFL